MSTSQHAVVFFDNDDYIETQINGDRDSITNYYLGKQFNIGTGENDLMATAKEVIVLDCKHSHERFSVYKFAVKCKKLGFKAYLAKSGIHGFITDNEGSRILSFERYYSGIKLSGNYRASRESGTGWQLLEFAPEDFSADDLKEWLYACAPSWANHNPNYTRLSDYWASYQQSSEFREV